MSHLFSPATALIFHVNIDITGDDNLAVVGSVVFDQDGEILDEQGGDRQEGTRLP